MTGRHEDMRAVRGLLSALAPGFPPWPRTQLAATTAKFCPFSVFVSVCLLSSGGLPKHAGRLTNEPASHTTAAPTLGAAERALAAAASPQRAASNANECPPDATGAAHATSIAAASTVAACLSSSASTKRSAHIAATVARRASCRAAIGAPRFAAAGHLLVGHVVRAADSKSRRL